VTCYLLHVMQEPDRDAYADPDLRDLVGEMPKFFCARANPIEPLLPSHAVRCFARTAPCWRAPERPRPG
jgi:hypothetical protein